jgi:diguanylate cyclase (GGDEF)-like protein
MVEPSDNSSGSANSFKEDLEAVDVAEEESGDVPATILVVDDEEVVCRFLKNVLGQAGHQVETCQSGQEAIARLKEDYFDLIITDLRMPGINGLGVLREAKKLDPFCEVIIITAYASVESAVKVMKHGAYDYIGKPFNIDHIRMVVDKAMEKRKLLQAAEERDLYKRLSQIDGLTDLYNYRTFYEILEAEIARARRYTHPLSLLMIDLDDLKVYNDTLGHPAGDEVLKEAARLLRKAVRNLDVVARYGGDEFAVILIETSREDAVTIAERLGRLVEETSVEHEDVFPRRTLTISIGVASYPTDATEKTELVAKADKALYEAKMMGGNLVRTAKS